MNDRLLRRAVPLALSLSLAFGAASAPAFASPAKAAEAISWSFAKDLEGWHYDGKWAYDGEPAALHLSEVGGGALAFDADYRSQKENGWSEVKFGAGAASEAQPLDVGRSNRLSFDFYFRPEAMTQGAFQTKVYMKTTAGAEVSAVTAIDTKNAADAGNGWKKAHVTAAFDTPAAPLTLLEVNIVGSETDYCGKLAIDNITLSYDDGYVTRTVQPAKQEKVDLKKLQTPAQVALTDAKAIPNAAKLYSFLGGIADSDYVLYGHMNDLLMHAGPGKAGTSDTYTMLHDYPAVMPIDAMTLAGNDTEYQNHEPPAGAYPPVTGQAAIDRAVEASERAAKLGAIVSLSAHMPNFAQVAAKGKTNGDYDFSGFTSVVTDGDVVRRVLPGGDLNPVFTAYLDKIAAYGLALQEKNIPVLFRPYHENNGSWFWWGAAHCSASEFKNLFRYTEEYLRDEKGVHNFLYVYSPNGPFTDEADYLTRYPGDAFIDVPGFDMYQEKPQAKDNWMENFAKNMDIVQSFAAKHGKITTIPETGILCGKDTLGRTGAQRKDWFTEALDVLSAHKFPYFSTWSNFNEDVFDQPYMVDKQRGHEMVDGFTRFYNDPRSVFAGQMPDWQKLDVQAVPAAATYGYLTAPSSNARITAPAKVTAKAAGTYQKAAFRFTDAAGKVIEEKAAAKAADGTFAASITSDLLEKIGKTVGNIDFLLDGKTVDSLRVFYNMPEVALPADVVDTFENYYGDNELLRGAYSTNCGPGCAIRPSLATDAAQKGDGSYGLDFHYSLVKGGWAGIIKSMGVDWSAYDAVSFWFYPDGKGQKFIIQMNSDGEDFEVNLTDLAKKTTPQHVVLPFKDFVGKNGGTFHPERLQHFAIYCNTVGDEPVDSHFYLDDIRAIRQ